MYFLKERCAVIVVVKNDDLVVIVVIVVFLLIVIVIVIAIVIIIYTRIDLIYNLVTKTLYILKKTAKDIAELHHFGNILLWCGLF